MGNYQRFSHCNRIDGTFVMEEENHSAVRILGVDPIENIDELVSLSRDRTTDLNNSDGNAIFDHGVLKEYLKKRSNRESVFDAITTTVVFDREFNLETGETTKHSYRISTNQCKISIRYYQSYESIFKKLTKIKRMSRWTDVMKISKISSRYNFTDSYPVGVAIDIDDIEMPMWRSSNQNVMLIYDMLSL